MNVCVIQCIIVLTNSMYFLLIYRKCTINYKAARCFQEDFTADHLEDNSRNVTQRSLLPHRQ